MGGKRVWVKGEKKGFSVKEHGDGHDANYDHWYDHNIHTDDYYPYYEQYQSDINICYSNLIEITLDVAFVGLVILGFLYISGFDCSPSF
jgi:hypothetical protein